MWPKHPLYHYLSGVLLNLAFCYYFYFCADDMYFKRISYTYVSVNVAWHKRQNEDFIFSFSPHHLSCFSFSYFLDLKQQQGISMHFNHRVMWIYTPRNYEWNFFQMDHTVAPTYLDIHLESISKYLSYYKFLLLEWELLIYRSF